MGFIAERSCLLDELQGKRIFFSDFTCSFHHIQYSKSRVNVSIARLLLHVLENVICIGELYIRLTNDRPLGTGLYLLVYLSFRLSVPALVSQSWE
jgi:hypothetical protein